MAGCFGKTCSCAGKKIYAKHQEPKRLKHIFRVYYFRRARTCFVCKQLVWNQGCACKVCRYICHRKCESKVMTSCVPQVNHDLSNETFGKTTTTSQPLSVNVSDNHNKGVMTTLRDMINRGQDPGGDQNRVSMDLTYITERLLAMSFPHEGHDSSYKASLKDVTQMLRMKHSDKYLVINISEKKADLTKLSPKVLDYGWPDHLAPPLERLCSICKSIDSWLSSDSQHVVVIHCKGARGKIAVIVAAYMHYCNICANADQELDRLAMQRFYNDKLGQFTKPSQRRYVNYFAGLLSGAIKINSNPLYLHHILIHGVANFDTKGGCRPFIKVYQAMQPVFTSGVYNVTENMQKVCISISPGIPLRGDILIKCYHKKSTTGQREPMWQCQYHTCAISNYKVIFSKDELDQGQNDPRFPDNGKIEFVFGPKSDASVSVSGFKSDVTVPVDDGGDGLVRWDSYENFNQLIENLNDINENAVTKTTTHKVLHAQGPVDGSLYAQVNKTRKTDNQVIMQNGPTHLPNGGSHTSSVDSGIHTNINTSGSSFMTSEVRNYSTNVNTSKSSYSSVSSKQAVKPLDEKTQLDDLLSDLLKDQATLTETSTGGPKVANTKTFTSYSSVDSNKSPTFTDDKTDQSAIHRAEVTYKLPGFKEETHHYTIKATMDDDKLFSPTSPSSERRVSSDTVSKVHTLPYRTDYENKYPAGYGYRTMDGSYSSWSDSEQTSSWLQEQQNKLQQKKDWQLRTPQAKQLVAELKTAQNKYMKTRAESEAEEQALMNKYNANMMNGPVSSGSYNYYYKSDSEQPFGYSQSYSTHYTSSTSGTKPPPSPGTQRSYTPTPQAPVRSSSKDYMQRNRSNSATSWQTYNRPLQRQGSDGAFDRYDQSYTYLSRSRSQTSPPKSPPRSFSPTQVGYSYSYSNATQRQEQQASRPPPPPPPENIAPAPAPPPVNYVTEVFVHRSPGVQKKEILVPDDKPDSTRLEELERTLQAASASIAQPQPANTGFSMKEDYSTRRSEKHFYETHTQNKFDQSTQKQPEVVSRPEPPKQFREIEEERIALKPIGAGVHVLEPEGGTGTLSRHQSRPPTPGFPTSPVQSAGGSNVVGPTGTVSYTQQTVSYQQQQQTNQQGGGAGGQIVSPTGTLVHGPGVHQPPTQIVSPTGTLQQGQGFQQQQQYQTQQQQQQQHFQTQQYSTQSNQQFSGSQGGTLHVDTSGRGYSQTSPRSPSSIGSPPSPGSSLHTLKQQLTTAHTMSGAPGALSPTSHTYGGQSSPSVYFGLSRRGSLSSLAEVDTITTPKFVKDTSKYWYKPNITREDAINLLKEATPGTFVIRDSNSFPGAFGLALKVAQVPPNVQTKSTGDPQADLVRHFLIEPTPKGVRLRGCSNEPVFGSLAALVYQHSITPLALPCKLHLPEADATVEGMDSVDSIKISADVPGSAAALLAQGAACNVVYLNSVDTESLTGPQAVAMAVKSSFAMDLNQRTTVVHFKVSNQGITLTDNQRRLFFRRHYPVAAVTYCGMDPEDRRFSRDTEVAGVKVEAKIFGFVARKQGGVSDNACHLFAELDPEQPASAIVNFVTKVMIGHGSKVKS